MRDANVAFNTYIYRYVSYFLISLPTVTLFYLLCCCSQRSGQAMARIEKLSEGCGSAFSGSTRRNSISLTTLSPSDMLNRLLGSKNCGTENVLQLKVKYF